jgi:putative redox protein
MAAKHPKSFISLDKADHLLSDKRDSMYVGAMVATWASRYIQSHDSVSFAE